MPRVVAKKDNLNDRNTEFTHLPLSQPVFMNSVPKSGTHLLRNILRMFVPVEQQYHDTFIQFPNLQQHRKAFASDKPMLSWGHLFFSDTSAIATRDVKQILLVRDPYDWVLARARFFLSDNFQGNMEHLKNGAVSIEAMMNMMIFGIYQKAPNLSEIYTHNGAAWLGTGVHLVRYEDLVHHLKHLDSVEAKAYFEVLIAQLGYPELPADWRERVKIGSDREQSGTARENLKGQQTEFPKSLPKAQRALVDVAIPGMRQLLGYD